MAGLAFGILAHSQPEQVIRLVKKIYSPQHSFCIHYDKKAPIDEFERLRSSLEPLPNVDVIRKYRVNWGGYSVTKAQIEMIRRLALSPRSWSHLINLSGQCYPIKPLSVIENFFSGRMNINFLSMITLNDTSCIESNNPRISRYAAFHVELLNQIVRIPFLRNRFIQLTSFAVGSQWAYLSRELCEWLINSEEARLILDLFRYSKISDEACFQTAALHSPMCKSIHFGPVRFQKWRDNTAHPDYLDRSHFYEIVGSPFLFARKFDYPKCKQLLDDIDQWSVP